MRPRSARTRSASRSASRGEARSVLPRDRSTKMAAVHFFGRAPRYFTTNTEFVFASFRRRW
eukprot:5501873-Prymnesium_polylepis.1